MVGGQDNLPRFSSGIEQSEGEAKKYAKIPIQLLVNYWEIRPSKLGAHLDRLLREGVTHVASFVPWQAVESDISHHLAKFLEALNARKMTVSLILTPEVGIHYPNSGLPKDLILKSDNMAQHCGKGQIQVNLPPNAHCIPSLLAPEFTKRYYSYLARMDGMLADFEKNRGIAISGVTLVLTGSFWKYYRSPLETTRSAFEGPAGDYSNHAAIAYRQRLEYYYAQSEFTDPTPLAANRWKVQAMDEVNRRWFYQQSEAVFRNRTAQFSRKKAASATVSEVELFTPEADPSLAYSRFLQMVSGGAGDFHKLSTLVDDMASLSSQGSQNSASSWIHWSCLGGFRSLTDAEKQFLILKSLILMGGQGGGLLIDEEEWFSLSRSFRTRTETIARSIAHGDLKLRTRALYLAPHLWTNPGTLWTETLNRLGANARMVASLDLALQERDANLLIVDPSVVMTREVVQKLVALARTGRMIVLPKSPLFTEKAKAELEAAASSTKRIEIGLDVPYRIYAMGEGKLILFDLPEGFDSLTKGESLKSWQNFLAGIFSLAGLHDYCRFSDSRLKVVALEKKDRSIGLFVMNSTRRQVAADIVFPTKVEVGDLAMSLTAAQSIGVPRPRGERPIPASRFALEVPPCGVLPLEVGGLALHDPQEQNEAEVVSAFNETNSLAAAQSELPGLEAGGIEGLWN